MEPLARQETPLASVTSLVAINTVKLSARNTPRAALAKFYGQTLGLTRVPEDTPGLMIFRHERRRVELSIENDPVKLMLAVTQFSTMMVRLRDAGVMYELIRFDEGVSRMLILHDPAKNIVQLIETRAF